MMRFRNAMVQGDYLPQLVKMLGEGGADVLKNLIETEKKPGEGISSIKADLMEMGMVVEELTGRVDDFEDALDVIRNHQKYMKEMIHEVCNCFLLALFCFVRFLFVLFVFVFVNCFHLICFVCMFFSFASFVSFVCFVCYGCFVCFVFCLFCFLFVLFVLREIQ